MRHSSRVNVLAVIKDRDFKHRSGDYRGLGLRLSYRDLGVGFSGFFIYLMTFRCISDCRWFTSVKTLRSHNLLSPTGAILTA